MTIFIKDSTLYQFLLKSLHFYNSKPIRLLGLIRRAPAV